MAETWTDYLRSLRDMISLDEEGENLPEFAAGTKRYMRSALDEGRGLYGESASPEADRYRHIMGMRRAAMDPEIGGLGAFMSGLGHEANNLRKSLLQGNLEQLGSPASRLGLMQILRNSGDDTINNFLGVLSAYRNQESLTPDAIQELLESGVMPADLRTPDDSVVMIEDEER